MPIYRKPEKTPIKPKPKLTVLPKPKRGQGKPYLRIRTYEGEVLCDVWLLVREGAGSQQVLYGKTHPDRAELIAGVLGLPVEREHRNFELKPTS